MMQEKIDRDFVLEELRKLKPELEKRYSVTRIGIFGSVARDEFREDSDIDVVVEMRKPDLFFMVHIKDELRARLRAKIDIVRYRETMNLRLKARIDKEALYV
jgi:predicted nucleotidyltransferase